jgi:hypothetical protein
MAELRTTLPGDSIAALSSGSSGAWQSDAHVSGDSLSSHAPFPQHGSMGVFEQVPL